MASTSETGHAKNVANFGKLIAIVKTFSHYNPTSQHISIIALQGLLTDSDLRVRDVADAVTVTTLATDKREATFAGLNKLATRISSAVAAQPDSAALLEDVKSIARKIKGERAAGSKKKKEDTTDDNTGDKADKSISVAQLSYTNQEVHLGNLISLLSGSNFNTNEQDMTIAALTQLQNDMISQNAAANTASAELDNVRLRRDRKLYDPELGLVNIALSVKNYVKSMTTQGAASPEYRQVAGILFTRPKS